MPIHVKCHTCGTVKSFTPSVAKNRKYCSAKCVRSDGENNPNWKGGLADRVCAVCYKGFQVKQKDVRAGNGLYCSNQCRHIGAGRTAAMKNALKRKNNCVCAVCAKEFYLKRSAVESGQGTYCSTECMSEGYRKTLTGKQNPNYRHGKSLIPSYYNNMRRSAEGSYTKEDIEFLFESQRGKCINCMKSIKGGYHIDHIYPVTKGGTNYPHNLQLLCQHCNCTKNAKDPIDWAQENGRLL